MKYKMMSNDVDNYPSIENNWIHPNKKRSELPLHSKSLKTSSLRK